MRIRWMIVAFLACAAAHGATLGDVYVEKNFCSNEIVFGDWPVKQRTAVHGEPSAESKQIGLLEPDTSVRTLACEAHIVPGIAQILDKPYKATGGLDPRQVVYLLESFEGGRTRVFQNGNFYITKIATRIGECESGNDVHRCWAKVLKEPRISMWIKVELAGSAETGWVRLGGGNILPTPRNDH